MLSPLERACSLARRGSICVSARLAQAAAGKRRMAMRSLMAMLRPKGADAGALYNAVVAEARQPAWYREGGVADTMDGRFAVLSTLAARATLRLEDGEEEAVRHSVALTESFIAD